MRALNLSYHIKRYFYIFALEMQNQTIMAKLYDFVEHWAQIYKPIQHTPDGKNKRFFFTIGFMGLVNFVQNADIKKSPCILMESNIEGELGDYDSTTHTIYCLVRATDATEGRSIQSAITEAKRHLRNLLTFLRVKKRDKKSNLNHLLSGVQPEQSVHYQTEGPIYDGWIAVYISIEEINTTTICVDDNDYIDKPAYDTLSKIKDMMHKITYSHLDYQYAYQHFQSRALVNAGACTSFRKGNIYARNYDWYMPTDDPLTHQPDFIITTSPSPDSDSKYKVKGIASVPGMTDEMATVKADSELWTILPFYLQDGMNDAGVFCNINVVPRDKGNNTATIPTIAEKEKVCVLMLVRYILDHFDSALSACDHIRKYVSVFIPQALKDMNYDCHLMVGDKVDTYIIEIVDNHIKYTRNNILTNFHIDGVSFRENGEVFTNADVADGNLPTSMGITPHGSGLERYNLVIDELSKEDFSQSDAKSLLNKLAYSKAYDLSTNPYWYSEFVSIDYDTTVDMPTDNPKLQAVIEAAQEIKRGEKDGRLWGSTHSVVYDLTNMTLSVKVMEQDDFINF